MALIICTIQEYHRFIGPLIRNKVNSLTRNVRIERNGICEFCGEKNILESAHVHGKGRKTIIENVLSEYLNDNFVQGNLLEIEKKILNAHLPLENTFKFICKPCHTEYDNNEVLEKPEKIVSIPKTCSLNENSEFTKLNRIELWSKREHQANHKIIRAFLEISKNRKVTLEQLKNNCIGEKYGIETSKFDGNFNAMKTDKANAHGKVFYEQNGFVEIYPVVMNEIEEYFK